MRKGLLVILLLCSIAGMSWNWWPLPMAEPDTTDKDSLIYLASLSATAGSGRFSASMISENEQGATAITPFSGSLRAAIIKPATRPRRWYDYDGAIDITGMIHSPLDEAIYGNGQGRFPVYRGKQGSVIIRQCYAHVRLYIIDFSAGVMPVSDHMDTPLGTGSLLLSHNAPSMPTLHIGIDRWTPIPGLFGYLEIKGGLTHAWLTDNIAVHNSMLHYKYAGAQLGGRLPVNISYEFHHAAQWGGYDAAGNDLGNDLHSFKNVFLAHSGGHSYNESFNAQGNHLGSQQLALTLQGKGWHIKGYWQNLLEDNFNFIGRGQNLSDGRWGISMEQERWPFIQCVNMEYINTTDQSGPMHDQDGIIYAGRDDYYRNGVYGQGWSYYGYSIGTPLITSPLYSAGTDTQTLNNRVQAWHIGVGGDIYGFRYALMATYARNYGRYQTDDWYEEKSHNTALMAEVKKQVRQAWGLEFGLRLAADCGTQWGNRFSAMLTITKQGLIKQY